MMICLMLILCCDWSDPLTKLIVGCNITFQPSDSELRDPYAQFSTKLLIRNPTEVN